MTATWRILEGDCRDVLGSLDAGSVQTCVTSPPYFGLRDYGHEGQIGLEPTPDEFVAALVSVFREVRRVLRDDGTVWLNLGDSYYSPTATQGRNEHKSMGAISPGGVGQRLLSGSTTYRRNVDGVKPKDLIGIPWMVAFALRADGWVLRQEIIWAKSNPMPESVTDRCTKSHEQIFMFSKALWTGAEEPLPMRDVDAAWLAALVDGEGSICFQDRTSEGAGTPTWSVRLSIVNTNRALLERVEEICGLAGVGSPSPRTRRDGAPGRPVFAWQLTNAKAARVIAAIRPYLIAKKTQADLALYVQALNRKHTGRGGHTVSRADRDGKARAAAACSALNRGEPVDLSWFRSVKPGRWVPLPYAYDADAIREDASEVGIAREGRARITPAHSPPGTQPNRRSTSDGAAAWLSAGRNKRSVWTVSTQPYPGAHFATFPPKLIEPCILAGCPEGGTVLDPFAGAGTTGLVALRHNRSFVGIELNAEYVRLARDRIIGDQPLFNGASEVAA